MEQYCCEVEPENTPDLSAVVRCKDCKLRLTIMCPIMNKAFPIYKGDNWFCADGEKKESE